MNKLKEKTMLKKISVLLSTFILTFYTTHTFAVSPGAGQAQMQNNAPLQNIPKRTKQMNQNPPLRNQHINSPIQSNNMKKQNKSPRNQYQFSPRNQ